jgi:CRISPR type I-E-associated protein CasA/Cse1
MTMLNLLRDPCIPVITSSGEIKRVRVAEIGEPGLRICSSILDIEHGHLFFLIAIFQTLLAPEDTEEWEDLVLNRRTPEELQAELDKHAEAFEMFGEGPRFMQIEPFRREELIPEKRTKGAWVGIDNRAFMNRASSNSTEVLFDSVTVSSLDYRDAHALLMHRTVMGCQKIQNNARSAPWGQSRLQFLNLGQDLWETVIYNVLDDDDFRQLMNPEVPYTWEWMHDKLTIPDRETHSSAALYFLPTSDWYWDDPDEEGQVHHLYAHVCQAKQFGKYGVKWIEGDEWRHPMSPYRNKKLSGGGVVYSSQNAPESGGWNQFEYHSKGANYEDIAATQEALQNRCRDLSDELLDKWEAEYDHGMPSVRVFGIGRGNPAGLDAWNDYIHPQYYWPPNLQHMRPAYDRALSRAAEYVTKVSKEIDGAIKRWVRGAKGLIGHMDYTLKSRADDLFLTLENDLYFAVRAETPAEAQAAMQAALSKFEKAVWDRGMTFFVQRTNYSPSNALRVIKNNDNKTACLAQEVSELRRKKRAFIGMLLKPEEDKTQPTA